MNPLAIRLARAIFALGDAGEDNDKTQRIQFMGGTYPDHETNLGGVCESSLASFLDYELARTAKPGAQHE